jgi:signal transduction histidine kinase
MVEQMPRIGEILIRNEHEIPFARQLTQRLCLLVKLSIVNQARLTTAISQVTQTLYLYCRCVHISFDVDTREGHPWLVVTMEERHPTAPLVQDVLDSKLSRNDLLKLLEGVRTIISAFSTEMAEGEPIRVTAAKPFPRWQPSVPVETFAEWAEILNQEPSRNPIEGILQQNRVLVDLLDALREKDAALEKKIQEIEALEKMRDDLVHALVHDLRNPLASIRTSLSGLLSANVANLSQYQNTMVEISYLAVVKLTRLVDNILDVYKLEGDKLVMEPVSFSLSGLVDRLLRLQLPLLEEKNLRVEIRIPEEIPHVDGDLDLLERVIQNLLDNAIKFAPDGGEISITVEPQLTGEWRPPPGEFARFIMVRIRDSGPGVSEAVRKTLFEKFSTAQAQESGSGLGLAFCKLVIQAHGGDIWVEGQPGEGAEFVFVLPTAEESAGVKDPFHV